VSREKHVAMVALIAAALALPSLARADVLEIHGTRCTWIAGGPAQTDLRDAGIALPGTPAASALTQVADDAGPPQWRAHVGQVASRFDLSPALLEAVVWQESRWNARAISPAGARGLAQLMPGTARQLGVNPDDPAANLAGGARYLRMQLDAFDGDVEKALAAYNAGPARVRRAGGIPPIAETRAYVAAILARLSAPVRR
jgi:soluble lytic murein transglycosylase-like protein